MTKQQLNVGMVGYKFMGKAHSSAYANLPLFFDAGVPVCRRALCGRDAQWLAQSAKRFGWESVETDWKKLVSRSDIDIIDITAPSDTHHDIAVAAAENGKHVFCEKPLALTLGQARDMLDAVRKNKVTHQIGFNYRFVPAVQLARKLIAEGKLGTIRRVRASYLQDFIIDPAFPLVWRLQKSVCGSGALGDLGAHFIDLARYLAGEFKSVTGIQKTFVTRRPLVGQSEGLGAKADHTACGDVDVDDATVFLAEFENGALGIFEATRFAQGHKNDLSIEVGGDRGSIRFSFERMNELEYFSADDDKETQGFRLIQASDGVHPYMQAWWSAGHVIGYENTFVHELYEFVRAIVHEQPASPDFEDGVKCAQVLEAVELSAARRATVDVAAL